MEQIHFRIKEYIYALQNAKRGGVIDKIKTEEEIIEEVVNYIFNEEDKIWGKIVKAWKAGTLKPMREKV